MLSDCHKRRRALSKAIRRRNPRCVPPPRRSESLPAVFAHRTQNSTSAQSVPAALQAPDAKAHHAALVPSIRCKINALHVQDPAILPPSYKDLFPFLRLNRDVYEPARFSRVASFRVFTTIWPMAAERQIPARAVFPLSITIYANLRIPAHQLSKIHCRVHTIAFMTSPPGLSFDPACESTIGS